ncbi:MAG: hypothetical protein HXL80_01675 [[Eubacterium] sulci]|nr:hypothetical protein [[Eubacterium] sulci]
MLKGELFKIFKRKESFLLWLILLVPILYGSGFASGSPSFTYNGNGLVSCMEWIVIMCNIVYQIAIFHIFSSIIAVRSLGSEIADTSIQLYLYRINNRKSIFITRVTATLIYFTVCFCSFIGTSIVVYYTIMLKFATIASGDFLSARSHGLLFIIINTYISYLLVIAIAFCLSIFLKPLTAIAASVLIHIISLFACQLGFVCYIVPLFYFNRLQDIFFNGIDAIGNKNLYFFSKDINVLFLFGAVISILYIIVSLFVGIRKFIARDLD